MQIPKSEVNTDSFYKKIDYDSKVVFTGSCFSENIGQKLETVKIPVIINPFGILYNPESVRQSLQYIIDNKMFKSDNLFFHNEKWISFSHHGKYSGQNKNEVLDKINTSIKNAHLFLKKTDILYITFGTFRAYKLLNTNNVVANCHKLPAKNFSNELLDFEQTYNAYCNLLEQLHVFNPELDIVFTVSPVRHWKDGAVNNQLSKSYLSVLTHKLVDKYDFAHYFPSYEIMMDDLRDYRFYADDLFHPSKLAVDYIWSKFEETFLGQKAIETAKKIQKLVKNLNHKVFYPKSDEYKKFVISNIKQINQLQNQLPNIDFSKELIYFQKEYEMSNQPLQ